MSVVLLLFCLRMPIFHCYCNLCEIIVISYVMLISIYLVSLRDMITWPYRTALASKLINGQFINNNQMHDLSDKSAKYLMDPGS